MLMLKGHVEYNYLSSNMIKIQKKILCYSYYKPLIKTYVGFNKNF